MPPIPTHRLPEDDGLYAGKIDILISGFSKQNVVTNAEIARGLEILPDAHLDGLDIVKFDPQGTSHSHAGHYVGVVDPTFGNAQGILIEAVRNKTGFFETLYHEVGHFVFAQIIDSNLRKRWVTQMHPACGCVTPYAKRNGKEDFAESYAYYVFQPDKLRLLAPKFDFMQREVFGGFVPNASPLGLSG